MRSKKLIKKIVSLTEVGIIELGEPIDTARARDVAEHLRRRGFHTHIIDLGDTADTDLEQTLFHELDRGFRFPEYFGENWNAVDECINDLSWLPADGYCCLVLNRQALRAHSRQVEKLLVAVMSDASTQWARERKRFCLVLSP